MQGRRFSNCLQQSNPRELHLHSAFLENRDRAAACGIFRTAKQQQGFAPHKLDIPWAWKPTSECPHYDACRFKSKERLECSSQRVKRMNCALRSWREGCASTTVTHHANRVSSTRICLMKCPINVDCLFGGEALFDDGRHYAERGLHENVRPHRRPKQDRVRYRPPSPPE